MIDQRELCQRIAWTLETAPIHDHLGYEALAYLKLPGPDYKDVLRVLHRAVNPKLYVEIGVRRGDTLALAGLETKVIGIDPNPQLGGFDMEGRDLSMSVTTSDRFFDREECRAKVRGFDLALIDGDHESGQALQDFENLASLAKETSIILLHDVIPMDERTASPKCKSSFWTGDVWRLMAAIVSEKKFTAFTIACPPTGLGLVGGYRLRNRLDTDEVVEWMATPLDMDWDVLVKRLNIIPNTVEAITAEFRRKLAA